MLDKYKDFFKRKNKRDNKSFHNGDFRVTKDMVINNKLDITKIPNIIFGDFDCSSLNLTTLENSPEDVNGNFICFKNNLTSLKGISTNIKGNVLSEFNIENDFVKSEFYKNVSYYNELVDYLIKNKIDMSLIKSWPEDDENYYLNKNEGVIFNQYQTLKSLLYDINRFGKFSIYKENWNVYDDTENIVGKYYMFIDHNSILTIDKLNFKKKDHEKQFVEQLIKFANEYKLYIAVSPDKINDYKTKNKVKKFYKELGFIKNTNLPYTAETMYKKYE